MFSFVLSPFTTILKFEIQSFITATVLTFGMGGGGEAEEKENTCTPVDTCGLVTTADESERYFML